MNSLSPSRSIPPDISRLVNRLSSVMLLKSSSTKQKYSFSSLSGSSGSGIVLG